MEKTRCYGCMKLKSPGDVCEHCGYDQRQGNAPHQLPAGTVLKEKYLIGKVLGQGGFGITYLGWDLYLDIPVAVKEYYPTGTVMRETSMTMDVVSCGDEAGVRFRNNKERFLREAKMLARFSQVPEIVQVRNFFLANNTAYIVMEYVDGITLKQYVRDHGGKLSMEKTLAILGPMIRTMGKVHKAGIVHRDISPDNIMMLPDGTAKLLDFGAVRDVGAATVDKNLTKSTEAILKPGYAPIEQYLAHGNLGPWTDVYAMCATIFFCLTGQVPPASPERVLGEEEMNLEKELPALSAEQRAALEHGLKVRANERTGSMEELYGELFDQGPNPDPDPDPNPDPDPRKKQRWLYALAAVLAVCAIVFGVRALNGGNDDDPPPTTAPSTAPTTAPTTEPITEPTIPTDANGNPLSGKCGVGVNWAFDPETGELTVSGKGKMWNFGSDGLTIPWQAHKDRIKSVRIESGIASVGDHAFSQYKNLTAVELPDTLEEIGAYAFDRCAITELRLPKGLKIIGECAFRGNPINALVIPDGVTHVGDCAFNECAIAELTLPDGLKTIGFGAFCWSPIETLVIPDSVTYVGADAFNHNGALQSVTVGPDTRLAYDWLLVFSPVTIRGYTNSMAEDYARILGCNFESIGTKTWDAEGRCGDKLNWHLDFETGFLKIDGEGAMWDFNGTTQEDNKNEWKEGRELPPWSTYQGKIYVVSIGDAVTSIGEFAFVQCDNLVDVHFGKSLKQISTQAFQGTAVDQIILPESVTDIAPWAFNWCTSLTEIRLPESLKWLEENAIAECGNLQWLYVGKDTMIGESHGLPFTFDENCSTTYPNLTIVSLPGSDAERFAKEYNFPFKTGVRGMVAEDEGQCGDNVFWFKSYDNLVLYGTGSTWLYDINDQDRAGWAHDCPEGQLKSGHPGYYEYRDEITDVIILPGVTVLGHNAFNGFPNLTWIDFGTLEEVWFSGKDASGDINLLNLMRGGASSPAFCIMPGSEVERYASENGIPFKAAGCPTIINNGNLLSGKCGENLTWTLDLDAGALTVSGEGRMWDFGSDGLTIPWRAHKDRIKSVRIESGVTSVGMAAFSQCGNLTALELPDTLEEIGATAFYECALTELRLPDGLKTIGRGAFAWNREPIKNLVIPDSVQYVDGGSFPHNDSMVSVTIGPDTRLNYDTWDPIFLADFGLTIRGYTNSMAEDYARILGCDFESIGTKTWDAEGQCGDKLNWHLDFKTGFLKIDGEGDMWDFNGRWMSGVNEYQWVEGRELPPWDKYLGRIYAISIGDAVTSIGLSAFECCDNLVDVHFGKSLTRIGTHAFLGAAVEQIVLPENVTEIAHHAFSGCNNLVEMRLPEGLERLDENAISECGNLERLFVGKDTVIYESHGLPFTDEEFNTTYPKLTIISLPRSDAERFAKEYNFPFKTGVRGMVAEDEGQCGDKVFWFKSYSTLVLYGTGSTWLYGIDDQQRADWALKDYPENQLRYDYPDYYKYRDEITDVVILPGVTTLMHSAFCGFSKLAWIDFGTLEEAHFAIHECPSLEVVYLPDSLTRVGGWMLGNNPNLREVHIANGSEYFYEGVFEYCFALEKVWFNGRESIDMNSNLLNPQGGNPPDPIFYVKPGSDAERYAKEYGVRYEYY